MTLVTRKKRSGLYIISLFVIYCLAVMSISPIIRSLPFFNYLWPLLMMLWIFVTFIYQPDFYIKSNLHQLITFLFFFYAIFIAFTAGNGFIGNRFLEYLQIFIFYWAYQYNKIYGYKFDSLKLLSYFAPVVIITSIMTVMQYITNPNISRTAKKDTAAGLEQMSQGVAGYEFIYFLVFIFASLLFVIVGRKLRFNFFTKVLLYFVLLLFLINIVLSNFMIAVLLVLISLFFRFIIPKVTTIRILVYIITFLLISPVLPYLFVQLIDFALSISGSSMNAQRLLEMRELLVSGLIDLSLGARLDAFQSSLNAFLNNPIMGIITTDIGGHGSGLSGFGQHSFLLDTFALFGGFIGILSLYVYFQPLIIQFKLNKQQKSSLPLLIILITLLFFIINNLTPSIGFAIYFVFPVLHDWSCSNKQSYYLPQVKN